MRIEIELNARDAERLQIIASRFGCSPAEAAKMLLLDRIEQVERQSAKRQKPKRSRAERLQGIKQANKQRADRCTESTCIQCKYRFGCPQYCSRTIARNECASCSENSGCSSYHERIWEIQQHKQDCERMLAVSTGADQSKRKPNTVTSADL